MRIPQFIALISSSALLIILGAWLLISGYEEQYSLGAIIAALSVSFIPTIIAYSLTYKALERSTRQFLQMLMTGMLAKMFVGLISIVIIAVRFREVRDEYVIAYMIAYFVFTGFEVYGLMRKLRPISNKGTNTKND